MNSTAQPGTILAVIHNFAARSPDELSLTKGDKIELLEKDDDFGDGWFLGKHLTNGQTGLFPEVYTRPAPKGTTVAPAFNTEKRAVSEDFSNKQPTPAPTTDNRASAPVNITSQNPVMNETLDVIKEHMNDMSAPMAESPELNPTRASYIRGHETDEEEQNHLHTEAEVKNWSSDRVAEYLEDQGVEKQHCKVFREQEITGEVLLDMEQSSIFIKEFDLGPVGRRLKTWGKIKALQEEVRAAGASHHAPGSVSDYGVDAAHRRNRSGAGEDLRNFSGTTSMNQYLTSTAPGVRPSTSSQVRSSTMPVSSPQANARPSAQSIRSMNHARRHSSLGSDIAVQQAMGAPEPSSGKRLSFFGHRHSVSSSTQNLRDPQSSPDEADRGYFSGGDQEKKRRSVLQKRPTSTSHSRSPSATADPNFSQSKVDQPAATAAAAAAFTGSRSVSTPKPLTQTTDQASASPMVTRLDYDDHRSPTLTNEASSTGHSPATNAFSFLSKSRIPGLRVLSEPLRNREISKPIPIESPARTGSTTPSERQSIEQQKSENSTRLSNGSSQGANAAPALPTSRSRARPGTKQSTSAYTHGLQKKSPRDTIPLAEYSGWMKKKSASLVGNWKPRLFVLRGRRLSYYYSEDDTEEKGLIDISGHRVLPATSDRVTGLHAQIAGAISPQFEQQGKGSLQTTADTDKAMLPSPSADDEGLFIFKLVPPRQGLSKAVNFTRPTVHYFAVNSRQEGRLWMAALMKATIDHESGAGNVTTSYNQPTISLAKARARRERPPALREADALAAEEGEGLGLVLDAKGEPVDGDAEARPGTPETAGLTNSVSGSLRRKEAFQLIT